LNQALPEAVFTGYLRGKELAAAYASADVFVFPSTTDTFGNVVIEAQASGVPVIVSDTGGPKELVESNVNGVVTKSHDVEDLARAIRELVKNKRKREEMSRQARQAVVERSWPGAFRKFWAATEI
jgi:glycosyltransferase involved in cell wall biosynthesis